MLAGLASAISSCWGIFAWAWGGAGSSHSVLLVLFCLCPALSLIAFVLYFLQPSAGVIASWVLLSGMYISLFLTNLKPRMHGQCTTSNSLSIAWGTFIGMPILWLLVSVAGCLSLDSAAKTKEQVRRF